MESGAVGGEAVIVQLPAPVIEAIVGEARPSFGASWPLAVIKEIAERV
ncbi:hypothetical protein [Microbacterium sp. SD291]|nr:hypothetical protein [Microbacterium sp. SD291]MBO0981830.1 hypothetical protein [Microbacterium sp. SD291]